MALRLAGALVLFWRVRCHFSEGRDLLDAVLEGRHAEAPASTAKALWGYGFLRFMAGDAPGSLPSLERSLACFRELGDPQGCARALLILANVNQLRNHPEVLTWLEASAQLARVAGDHWCLAHARGVAGFEYVRHEELRAARPMLQECLAVARKAGDLQSLRMGLLGLGQLTVIQGEYAEADSLLDEAVRVTRARGEDFGQATALRYLGALALGRGDYVRARELLDESLALIPDAVPMGAKLDSLVLLAKVAHAQGDTREARRAVEAVLARGGHGAVLEQALAELAVEESDRETARRRFEDARDMAKAEDRKGQQAKALHGLGRLARLEGDLERAAELHVKALELHCQTGELPAIAASLEAVAGAAGAMGQHRHAARLFGAAQALRDRGGYARVAWESERYRSDRTLVSEALPADAYRRALADGAGLSLEEAAAEATGSRRARGATGWQSLTRRELEVVGLVAEGMTNPEIAERLVISLETVKTHVSHIFSKVGVPGPWELARQVRSRIGGGR